ncbi:MAG: radical SAM protein [Planctomycetes bacterium]|nr:radical SAM protein [Planctomycetota bacterium]
MNLAFFHTLGCTAECDHCITHAGPRVRRTMPFEEARRIVQMAARSRYITGIIFTGGENLIHRRQILELVRECTELGLKTEIITNGYWATRPSAAAEIAGAFRKAGLGRMHLSIDRYHLPYVSAERIHVALQALGDAGFLREIACVVEHDHDVPIRPHVTEILAHGGSLPAVGDEAGIRGFLETLRTSWPRELLGLLERYGIDPAETIFVEEAVALRDRLRAVELADHIVQSRILVQYQGMATEGRGRILLGKEGEPRHVDLLPDDPCESVGRNPTVIPEGGFSPCCSSWVNFPGQILGQLFSEELDDVLDRMRNDPMVDFMYHQGPRALAKYLHDCGHALPDRYTHPCHTCGVLLESYSREELMKHIEAFYLQHPERRVLTARGVRLVPESTLPIP